MPDAMSRNLIVVVLLAVSIHAQTVRKAGPETGAFFYAGKTNFLATGKWIPNDPGDKPAYPTETQLDCFRSMMQCVEGTADYYMGHPHITLNYLDVVKWDDNGIIATSNAGTCMTNTLVISFADKMLSATDS